MIGLQIRPLRVLKVADLLNYEAYKDFSLEDFEMILQESKRSAKRFWARPTRTATGRVAPIQMRSQRAAILP